MASARKSDVPDISGLLGQINEKRHDLPKAPIQSVQPVKPSPSPTETVKPEKQTNVKTPLRRTEEVAPGAGGRPSVKLEGVEYVKLSPRIPKPLKKRAEISLIEERFRDEQDRPVKTMDELVSLALARLLKE